MSFAACNPRMDFTGGADEALQVRVGAIVAELGERATDLGAGSWRVFGFNARTPDQAIDGLEGELDEIDPDWREVVAVYE